MDRRPSNDRYGRDSRQIERWETIKKIVDRIDEEGVLPIRLTVSIERPIFTNGDEGYCRVNATIGVGNYYVRLATKGLIALLDMISENRKAILDSVDSVRILNEQKDRAERQNSDGNREPSVPVRKEDYPILDEQHLDRSRERGSRERSRTRQTRNNDDRRR